MSGAAVDGRTEPLPFVDEHSILVAAEPEEVWAALLGVVERSFSAPGARVIAGLLGCRDTQAAGPRPLAPGSSCPGFHVAVAAGPSELGLFGRHRFSDYALIFRLDRLEGGQTRLRAETRAEFPALKGRLYRALVIGSRGHVMVVRGLFAATARRARALR